METFLSAYMNEHKSALDSIPLDKVAQLIELFHKAWKEDRQLFMAGNGGSAANASHFVVDLGKGASDAMGKPFRCMSLNDNTPWLTAIGNDYSYEKLFVRQLMNFARAGDLLFTMSVSGNSPNLVAAIEWAKAQGLYTIALIGGSGGKMAELADLVVAVNSKHFGRVEDAHMGICHMIAYAFMEQKSKEALPGT